MQSLIHVHLYMQLVASMDVNATIYSADTRIQECRKVRFAVYIYIHIYYVAMVTAGLYIAYTLYTSSIFNIV